MNKLTSDDHILPRPVERLPEYAHAKSRQSLAERVVEAFGLSQESADAIADAVVDPSAVRRAIGNPVDPEVEQIAVPGGTLLGVRTHVWARRIMPDARNPRTLPARKHPFAVPPGSGAEDSKFRPVPEPRSASPDQSRAAELVVDIESRHHLNWASQHAAAYVLAENDWRSSIESQGVMEAVWLVATTYAHSDGTEAATTLVTAEGSSRMTAVHQLLEVRSSDVPYDDRSDARLRAHIRKLNDTLDRGPTSKDLVALRCERVPALILVGFRPHPTATTGFATAVKSLVALRHVDPPKPWGEGPENESLADEVLDELYRRDLISQTERNYLAGSCTRSEAEAAHLSADPAARASKIVRLITSADERIKEAIRVAVTSQSTRRRITSKLSNELATALILRAVADEPARTDQFRRYMRHAFGKAIHHGQWQHTDRDVHQLTSDALGEVRRAIASGRIDEAGPASLEIAVRGAYALIVSGRLNADRGTANNEQPDRRTPGEVLDAMRRTPQGILQLGRALRDFSNDDPISAVDETGEARRLKDNSAVMEINDIYLRNEFPPPGKARAPRPGETAIDRYENHLSKLEDAVQSVERAFEELGQVRGNDGRPLVDARGVDSAVCQRWRDLLSRVDDELIVWSRTFRKAFGAANATPRSEVPESEEGRAELDPQDRASVETEWETDESESRQVS